MHKGEPRHVNPAKGRRRTPEIGELIELLYPVTTARALAEALGTSPKAVYMFANTRGIAKQTRSRKPIGYTRTHLGYLHQKVSDAEGQSFCFAHVLAWEAHAGIKKPLDHVVVFLDGDRLNFAPQNLYCMPKSELLGWMRFIRYPIDVHVDRLWRKVMALNTSDKVKQKLLDVLEQVSDPNQKPDLIRQRAVCETVQTLIGLLRVEVTYLQAIEGDGAIPFLDGVRRDAKKRKATANKRRGLLAGPPTDHPWRGLGSKNPT